MYTIDMNGKDVLVSHPSSPEPKVLPGWTWHAELVRQLIAERDELRSDAERYRWIRHQNNREEGARLLMNRMNADSAIDAARKVTP